MAREIRFFALKSKEEKSYWIEVRTVFNVKTTTTTTLIFLKTTNFVPTANIPT